VQCKKTGLITGDSLQKAVVRENGLAAKTNKSQQCGLAYGQSDITLVDAGDYVSVSNSCSSCINDLLNK